MYNGNCEIKKISHDFECLTWPICRTDNTSEGLLNEPNKPTNTHAFSYIHISFNLMGVFVNHMAYQSALVVIAFTVVPSRLSCLLMLYFLDVFHCLNNQPAIKLA